MSKNIRTQLGKVIGKTLNSYHTRVKPIIDDLKFKEQYQGRIIDCMVGEVDDNYIETPETDSAIVKLEHSKEGLVKIPSIKGKTILVDFEGNETDTPGEGCRLVSVGEDESNKMIILSKNKNIVNRKVADMKHSQGTYVTSDNGGHARPSSIEYLPKGKYIFSIDGYNVSNFVDASIIIWKEDLSTQTWRRTKINQPFEILDGEVGFTWYGAVNAGKGETITQLVGKNIQVELGETRTSYVEPKYHKTEILLDEPLRSLPNGVCDEIVGNQVIRRVGVYKITGTENVECYKTTQGNNYYNETSMAGLIYMEIPNNMVRNGLNLYSNRFKYMHNAWVSANIEEGICPVETGRRLSIRIYNEKTGINYEDTVPSCSEKIKKWLQNNPTTVYYELEEPIIEELPNGITLQGFDDTTMYIENTITPTVSYGYNALIPYKEELRTQKEEVETNTLDIENNIIPYLMDMEFNLMLMEDNE